MLLVKNRPMSSGPNHWAKLSHVNTRGTRWAALQDLGLGLDGSQQHPGERQHPDDEPDDSTM